LYRAGADVPSLLIYKEGSSIVFPDDIESEAILAWLNAHAFPLVVSLIVRD